MAWRFPALGKLNRITVTVSLLVLSAGAILLYKLYSLGYSLEETLPVRRHLVTYELGFDANGDDVRIRTFLPVTDVRQQVADEHNDSPGLHFTAEMESLNRVATWTGQSARNDSHIKYSFSVITHALRFELDPSLAVPSAYPSSVSNWLKPEEDIQVDDPEISRTLRRIGADSGTVVSRLQKIYDFTRELKSRPFKGTTDALTALRLGEASCNGKSRLFVALARAAGVPARLVGGVILESTKKRTSHQWVETYVAGHWVPFCPTNKYFAELPESYLTLYYGDQVLFRHSKDINFSYRFDMASALVPSTKAMASFKVFNVWALFERLGLPFLLLRSLLMLPFGALVVVMFRNVIGMPTFGTFLPALIAAGAGETGALWGVVAILIVVAAVASVRAFVHRLELLHSPTLAILLAAVTLTMLVVALWAERFGLIQLAHLTLFPIAVLAITAERFYLSLTEQGPMTAAKEIGGTLVVMLACFALMNSLALQVLVIGFPEVLLLVVAANIYLGRWVGVRLSEYRRFRGLLFEGAQR